MNDVEAGNSSHHILGKVPVTFRVTQMLYLSESKISFSQMHVPHTVVKS